jgi:hypothetical protein
LIICTFAGIREGVRSHVHRFLHGIGTQHGVAGGAAGHYIGMIPEDGKRMRCQRARRNMEYRGSKLARDLIHVRNHQQKPLRSCKRGRERPGLQRTVHRSRRAAFALHFNHVRHRSPDVLNSLGRPLIRHVGGGSDGINGDNFVQSIGDVSHRLVGIHRLKLALHNPLPAFDPWA